jgi:hypothetical protein
VGREHNETVTAGAGVPMGYIKRKWKVIVFRFKSWKFARDMRKQGVPYDVIANVFLSISGEYPYEKVREELAKYDVKI